MNTDLTEAQKDYSLFLPAISSFFSTYIGRQQAVEYVPKSRMPKGIPEMEMLNFFNKEEGLFTYDFGLYSAGHAKLDLTKEIPAENMIRKRGKHTTLVADSGGFQIGKGIWEADWIDPKCPKAEKYRSTVLKWLSNISDYSMTLDIPVWVADVPANAKKVNVKSYKDAVKATKYNHDYFIKYSTGDVKFLNVLQGGNYSEADDWYEIMKDYNDHTKYIRPFKGWAMGGANAADPYLALKRIITIIHDGLLEEGENDWMHFLGTSKLVWATMLTDIQRAVRRTHNKNFTVSFDAASPYLAVANGQIYNTVKTPDYKEVTKGNKRGTWSYNMESTADDRKFKNKNYHLDHRNFRDGVLADKIHDEFIDSPISENLLISDINAFGPTDPNKNGKIGKTAWDSFSYCLLMGHNTWAHINAVQEANRQYDNGKIPKLLIDKDTGVTFRNIVNAIFNAKGYDKRMAILDKHSEFFNAISNLRGFGGKKAISAKGKFDDLFE